MIKIIGGIVFLAVLNLLLYYIFKQWKYIDAFSQILFHVGATSIWFWAYILILKGIQYNKHKNMSCKEL